jgi:hypothetical protein
VRQPPVALLIRLEHIDDARAAAHIDTAVFAIDKHIIGAQGKAEIEPNRVLDDPGREAMTAVAQRSHLDILSDTPPSPFPFP